MCFICEELISFDRQVCEFCWSRLVRFSKSTLREGSSFNTRSLFKWEDEETLNPYIYALKGKRPNSYIHSLSLKMAVEFGCISTNYCFLFIESSRFGPISHGYLLAKSLSRYFNAPMCLINLSSKGNSQKSKSLASRKLLINQETVYLPFTKRDYSYVFVDDVIASGSSAEAVYNALGRPRGGLYQAWTVFDRVRLFKNCS